MRPSRRQLLMGTGATLALTGVASAIGRSAGEHKLLVVMADGGWDVTFLLDPKFHVDTTEGPEVDEDPDNPEDREALRTFGHLPLAVNDFKRPSVTAFFERYAARCTVVNGIWMGAIAHATARVRALTGTHTQANPAWATIAGHALGRDRPLGSIDLSAASFAGPLAASMGQVGKRAQLQTVLPGGDRFPLLDGRDSFRPDDTDRALLEDYLAARGQAHAATVAPEGRNPALIAARAEALDRAGRLRAEGADAFAGLNLGNAPSMSDQGLLAVDLLERDLCSAVTVGSQLGWDTHDNNQVQHSHFERLFRDLDRIVGELDARGMLDTTLVAVISEFTRTPQRNSTGGKDHWPHASCLLLGGPVHGNRVVGATDDRLESLPVDLATGEAISGGPFNKYDNLAAGLLLSLGVDPEPWFPTVVPFTAFFG